MRTGWVVLFVESAFEQESECDGFRLCTYGWDTWAWYSRSYQRKGDLELRRVLQVWFLLNSCAWFFIWRSVTIILATLIFKGFSYAQRYFTLNSSDCFGSRMVLFPKERRVFCFGSAMQFQVCALWHNLWVKLTICRFIIYFLGKKKKEKIQGNIENVISIRRKNSLE